MQIFLGLGLILLLPSAFAAPSESQGSLSPVLEEVSKKIEVDQVGVLEVENKEDKIVGGQDARGCEQFPYQVSIRLDGEHFCGGSIIKPSVILSAAHCRADIPDFVSRVTVRVGTIFRSTGGSIHQISSFKIHPKYNDTTTDFDVAVVKLKTPVKLGKCRAVVKLANCRTPEIPVSNLTRSTTPKIAVNALATVSGWGYLQSGATTLPETLQYVQVPRVSTADCKTAYGSSAITNNMICFGYTAGGKDSCQGDSGGPLVRNGIQYGIVSWGQGCADAGFPGIYTDVKQLSAWIQSNS